MCIACSPALLHSYHSSCHGSSVCLAIPATHFIPLLCWVKFLKLGVWEVPGFRQNSLRIRVVSLVSLWASATRLTPCPEQPLPDSVHPHILQPGLHCSGYHNQRTEEAQTWCQLARRVRPRDFVEPAGVSKAAQIGGPHISRCCDVGYTHVLEDFGREEADSIFLLSPSLTMDWSGMQWFTWPSEDISEAKKPAA